MVGLVDSSEELECECLHATFSSSKIFEFRRLSGSTYHLSTSPCSVCGALSTTVNVLPRWRYHTRQKIGMDLFVVVFLLLGVHLATSLQLPRRSLLHRGLGLTAKPVTYTAIEVPVCDNQRLLIKDTEPGILDAARTWTGSGAELKDQVDGWAKRGLAFWDSTQGLSQLCEAEGASRQRERDHLKLAEAQMDGLESYVNCATDRYRLSAHPTFPFL
jgi:hypothetical protein